MTNDEVKLILNRLDAIEVRVKRIESAHLAEGSRTSISQKPLSLSEFLRTKSATDDVKKTLAIGYFLEKYENLSSFTASDLINAFERAKERKPVNINDKVNMNIRNGHLEEASKKKDNHKAWYTTNSGAHVVENNFRKVKT